ncbi:MAG: DUF6765 family protein [Rectinema sp.]
MNIEFHYYTLYYLCASSGYPSAEALAIAVSSQMVDECTSPWRVRDPEGDFLTEVTQNYLFWDESVRRDIYLPFHFIPGDPGAASNARTDGKAGPHAVTPDSPLAREILIAALRTGDPYRIGIALHPYADTWAHQNFSGDTEPANAMDRDSILPAVGHLQALSMPDDPQTIWRDSRLRPDIGKIDNADRFLAAARMIYRFLAASRHRSFDDEYFVLDKLERIWKNSHRAKDSSTRSFNYIVDLDVPPYERGAWPRAAGATMPNADSAILSGYDRIAWLAASAGRGRNDSSRPVKGTIPGALWRDSHFGRWNAAAREHRNECRRSFSKRGI